MKVFQHTARYDSLIAGYLEKQVQGSETKFPPILSLQFERVETLRYGENPHQQGAFYRELNTTEPSVSRATYVARQSHVVQQLSRCQFGLGVSQRVCRDRRRDREAQ